MNKSHRDRRQSEFITQVKAVNNQITDQQAIALWNVRDAACALLAFRMGERIVIKKSVKGERR